MFRLGPGFGFGSSFSFFVSEFINFLRNPSFLRLGFLGGLILTAGVSCLDFLLGLLDAGAELPARRREGVRRAQGAIRCRAGRCRPEVVEAR